MSVALIVGASSGIGHEVARILLGKGWTVGIAARRTDALQTLADEFPSQTQVFAIDITAESAAEEFDKAVTALGGIDLYFHAAGVGWQNELLASDIEERTLTTNALGFSRMIGAAFRYFSARGKGHIAAISSIAGTKGLGPAASYSATKAFQNTYLEALAQLAHARRLHIDITDIRPGFVRTALLGENPRFPMLMSVRPVAEDIVRAIERRKAVRVIDWRYRLLVRLWRLLPASIWRRLPLRARQ